VKTEIISLEVVEYLKNLENNLKKKIVLRKKLGEN